MNTDQLKSFIDAFWNDQILPSLADCIRIPDKSPAFDPQWAEHGSMEDAVTPMVGRAEGMGPWIPVRRATSSTAARFSGAA